MRSFLIQALSYTNAFFSSSPSCKVSLDDPSWPTSSKWASLNNSLAGQLLKPSPPGAVCHPSRPEYNAVTCQKLLQDWFIVDFYAGDPISSAWSNWNNDSCVPWNPAPCSGEGFPVYVINATRKEDVKKGVDFARENNVRLVVKASGHDYLGR